MIAVIEQLKSVPIVIGHCNQQQTNQSISIEWWLAVSHW